MTIEGIKDGGIATGEKASNKEVQYKGEELELESMVEKKFGIDVEIVLMDREEVVCVVGQEEGLYLVG